MGLPIHNPQDRDALANELREIVLGRRRHDQRQVEVGRSTHQGNDCLVTALWVGGIHDHHHWHTQGADAAQYTE